MIRIGIVGFDTSHAVEFTKRVNHADISKDQWVDGARIVIGFPGKESSFVTNEVIAERTKTMKHLGVNIVDSPGSLIGEVDAIMIELQDGGQHFAQAEPFIEAGLPIFIDKPFTCSVADAKKIRDLTQEIDVPIFSSSSLRYALEVQDLKSHKEYGRTLGADVYSPGRIHPKNPGLFNYGIHGVEMLYALMGRGCKSLRCVWDNRWEITVGQWSDGSIGTIRAIREGEKDYGYTSFFEKNIVQSTIDRSHIYRELLKRIIEMFKSGKTPIDIEETIEIVAFIQASLESANNYGEERNLRM